jgi:probable F420-dependent oxidoreductase
VIQAHSIDAKRRETQKMQFGAVLPHNEIGTDSGAMRAWAQGVEALGATHILIYDHVLGADPNRPGGWQGGYDKDTAFHEPLTTFAFIAAVTTRVDLMSAVLILPQRQTALVAKQAAQVALLSGNRFRLGIGTGWNTIEYEALGVPFRARGRRQEEQVNLLRALWREDSLSFDGEFHRVDAASINPRPSRSIPIWFGGSAPAMLERCARLGDGWIPLMGANETARQCIGTLRSLGAAAGRDMTGFGIQAQAQYRGGTPERWRTHAEAWRELGATHLALATHNAGETGVDGHLRRLAQYLDAVR